jgi:acetolactate synthase-1/2/3 large subunit
VHWARAWKQLKQLAELLGAPGTTSLGGKSALPEVHELALGSGGLAVPQTVRHFLDHADVILGIGCSFTETNFGVARPKAVAANRAPLTPPQGVAAESRWSAMRGSVASSQNLLSGPDAARPG